LPFFFFTLTARTLNLHSIASGFSILTAVLLAALQLLAVLLAALQVACYRAFGLTLAL
jgi:hypothetical protein